MKHPMGDDDVTESVRHKRHLVFKRCHKCDCMEPFANMPIEYYRSIHTACVKISGHVSEWRFHERSHLLARSQILSTI